MSKLSFLFFFLAFLAMNAQKRTDTISLYFKNNLSTPTFKHIKIIDSILLGQGEVRKIDVIGFANNIASKAYNLELSKKRAINISKKIKTRHLGNITWKGELPSIEPKNRRVDLVINYTQIETPKEKYLPPKKTKTNTLPPKFHELKKGDKVILENILFYPGYDVFTENSILALKELHQFLLKNSSINFKIIGHICCSPHIDPEIDGYNTRTGKKNLSVARAEAIYLFLAKKGIDKNRMSFEGMARKFPLGKEDYLDRRVEIEIIDK